MNHKLIEDNYLIIKNFIPSYRANLLKEEFNEYVKVNNIKGDNQAPNSYSVYNYISFLELLCEKTPEVSSILEETVLPTYAYARVYKKGNILKSHTDRDACEISLTVHLGADSEWPIFIKNSEGKDCSVILNPGDAMLYLGCTADHWREEYLGEEYSQIFLHYVRSRGNKMYAYFDNNIENMKKYEKYNYNKNCDVIDSNSNSDQIKNEDEELNIAEKVNSIFEEREVKKIEYNANEYENNSIINPIKVGKSNIFSKKPITITPLLKLEDFIHVFEDMMPDYVCENIINEYKDCDEWEQSGIASGINPAIRSSHAIAISSKSSVEKNIDKRTELDTIIYNVTNNCLKQYRRIHNTLDIDIDTGYDLLRYKTGEYYSEHTDSFQKQQRSISCSILLNDDYDGGEFAFFNREMIIKCKKGSAIIFPSNFMFPHEIMPVIDGTRYSIVTWFI
jgi:hypothetical protein